MRLLYQLSYGVQRTGQAEQRAWGSHEHDHQVQGHRARGAVSEEVQ